MDFEGYKDFYLAGYWFPYYHPWNPNSVPRLPYHKHPDHFTMYERISIRAAMLFDWRLVEINGELKAIPK